MNKWTTMEFEDYLRSKGKTYIRYIILQDTERFIVDNGEEPASIFIFNSPDNIDSADDAYITLSHMIKTDQSYHDLVQSEIDSLLYPIQPAIK